MTDSEYAPISDYALIGDCHGTALVRRDGSIDWACLDRFDSGGIFCRLLDSHRGGTFSFALVSILEVHRRYLPDTNVLETTFVTATGRARLVDCFAMRRGGREHPLRQLLRFAEGLEGHVTLGVTIAPRFDYGQLHPWLRDHPGERVHSAVGGNDAMRRGALRWHSTPRPQWTRRSRTESETRGPRPRGRNISGTRRAPRPLWRPGSRALS